MLCQNCAKEKAVFVCVAVVGNDGLRHTGLLWVYNIYVML